jgi:uncharacterized protein YdhG (YjbR/CyaY superfamily)
LCGVYLSRAALVNELAGDSGWTYSQLVSGRVHSKIMSTRKARPKSIAEYINAAPKEAQKKLREMRACIRASAPGAKEGLKWGMPAFSYRRILVMFAAFKKHIGFYPTSSAVTAFAGDLSKFVTARGSIQFPLEKPLPLPLIRKITAFRVRESTEEDKKWRT